MEPLNPPDEELSDDELMELERFLASPELVESSLDVVGLDGYFAALLVAPQIVEPAEWTPWIWDVDRGEISPAFESPEQEQRIVGLLTRFYNAVDRALTPGSEGFEPLIEEGDTAAATNWCIGFLAGMQFDSEAWSEVALERPKWFAPILGLGLEEEEGPPPRKSQLERWTRGLGPAVTKIRDHWFEERQARAAGWNSGSFPAGAGPASVPAAPTAGRNDPCPCGSGRKYKRCCGAPSATPN